MDTDLVLVIFVERTDGKKIKSQFPQYYKYTYDINPEKLLEKALNGNYLKESDYKYNMFQATNKKLKDILKKFNLKVSGKKKELIERLLNNVDKNKLKSIFDEAFYMMTDKGKELVDKNNHLIYYHKNQSLYNFSISKYHNMVVNEGLDKYTAAINLFKEKANQYKNDGNWGLYRNCLLSISDVYNDIGLDKDSLQYLLKVCHIDLSGLGNNNTYTPSLILIAPGIIGKIKSRKNALEIGEEEIKNLYLSAAAEFNLPKKRYSNKKIFEYIIRAINIGVDEVNKIIKLENKNSKSDILDLKNNKKRINTNKKINKKLSKDWEECPRCDSKKVKHHETGWFVNIFATLGCGGIIALILGSIFPLSLFIIIPVFIIAGISNIKKPEFECKNCGAMWDKENNKKNKNNKKITNNLINNKPTFTDSLAKIFIIFLTITFPPIGILGVYKTNYFSKKSKIIASVWLGVFILFLFTADFNSTNDLTQESNEALSEQQEVIEEVNPKDMELDEYIDYMVTETVGSSTNNGYTRLLEYSESELDGVLSIELYANENLTSNMTRRGIILDSKKIFVEYFTNRNDYDDLVLEWYLTLVDQRGNESLGRVLLISFDRQNFDTVNWERVLTDDIPDIANSYWTHPAIR